MAERIYEYFLEPKNDRTKRIISLNVPEGSLPEYIVCADGQTRNLWKCPSGLVFELWRNRSNMKIKFRIFNREGNNGQLRNCTFLFKNDSGGKKRKKQKRRNYGKFKKNSKATRQRQAAFLLFTLKKTP